MEHALSYRVRQYRCSLAATIRRAAQGYVLVASAQPYVGWCTTVRVNGPSLELAVVIPQAVDVDGRVGERRVSK